MMVEPNKPVLSGCHELDDLRTRNDSLREQNAALLEALRDLVFYEGTPMTQEARDELVGRARAAIAQASEE